MIPTNERMMRDAYLDKPLPSSPEAERAILGAILLDNQAIDLAIQTISESDFYSPLHRKIFKAMVSLYEKSQNIDPILIGEEIKKDGSLDSIGGIASITNLTYGLPFGFDITDMLKIVKGKSIARNLVRICGDIASEVLAEDEDVLDSLEKAEQSIFQLRPNDHKKGLMQAGKIVRAALTKMQELSQSARSNNALFGLSTGFKELDRKLAGLKKGDLIILGGRPSMGKSSLALDIALNATDDDRDAVVVVFSLEVDEESNGLRLVSQRAVVDSQRLKQNLLAPSEIEKVNFAVNEIDHKRIIIDDETGLSALDIRARARRFLAEQKKVDLIIVDHIELVEPHDRKAEKRHQLGEIAKSLKQTAKMLDVPVVLLTPLNRECEKRNPPRPMMSDLAESGVIEYHADVVLLVYREEYYPRFRSDSNKGKAEIIVAKNRNNPTGTVDLAWVGYATTFQNLENI